MALRIAAVYCLTARFNKILNSVYCCSDEEKLRQGLFENYLKVSYKDLKLTRTSLGLDWMLLGDALSSKTMSLQLFELQRYQPFLPVVFHLLFASNVFVKLDMPFWNFEVPKITKAKEITYDPFPPQLLGYVKSHLSRFPWQANSTSKLEMFTFFKKVMFDGFQSACQSTVHNVKLIDRLKAEKFDVAVIHMIDICSFGLVHVLGIDSYIWFSTAFMIDPMAWYSGTPMPWSYVPSGANVVSDRMTFAERFKNTLMGLVVHVVTSCFMVPPITRIYRQKFGKDFPDIRDQLRKTQLVYINADHFFEYPRPTMPNVVYVGGLTMQQPEPLSEEWEEIVSTTRAKKYGIVVFSLGTVANTTHMPMASKESLLKAFRQLPHQVIWRIEGKLPSGIKSAENVFKTAWIPQKDLLAHPSIRLFITHGGYNSLTEATYLGVPLVVLPLFGDQHANVKRVVRLGIGVSLDLNNLTADSVTFALNSVLSNDSFNQNAKRLSAMMKRKPISSLELAISWLELLAEFKSLPNLEPASHQLNLLQYFLLDVYLAIFGIVLTFLLTLSCLLRLCCRRLFCSKRTTTTRRPPQPQQQQQQSKKKSVKKE